MAERVALSVRIAEQLKALDVHVNDARIYFSLNGLSHLERARAVANWLHYSYCLDEAKATGRSVEEIYREDFSKLLAQAKTFKPGVRPRKPTDSVKG
jgi:hypothetical protein